MAIDTRDKRASAIGFCEPWNAIAPEPDGSLASLSDRQHLAFGYRGLGVPPTLSTAQIQGGGTELYLLFDKVVDFGAGGNGGFVATMSGGASALTYASGSGTTALIYTWARTISSGETGTLDYTQPGNGIEDANDIDLASFSGVALAFANLRFNRDLRHNDPTLNWFTNTSYSDTSLEHNS